MAFRFLQRLSTFFNGFLLSSAAFHFLQRLSDFPQWLSDFPQRLSSFQEIPENLFTAASIQKITIRASSSHHLLPKLCNHHLLPELRNCHSLPELCNCHSLPELRNRYNACISPNSTY
jgi:hypothetical protein